MDLTVIGLGNPGARYLSTRHNIGFRTVDLLAERLGVRFKKQFLKQYLLAEGRYAGGRLRLVKPLTYMNRSGDIFPEVLKRTGSRVEDILVVCDTLDLPPGQCRLKRKGSSAGQKGLESIIRRLGRSDFLRLSVGIGRPGRRTDVVDFVLSVPRGEEALLLEEAVHQACDAVLRLMEGGLERIMNVVNKKNAEP